MMAHQPRGQRKDEAGEGGEGGWGCCTRGAQVSCAPIAGAGQSLGWKPDLGTPGW